MILDIFKDSFEYGAQDIKTLLKLGLFSFFSFLIIPMFLLLGYEYRVIKIAINGMIDGGDELPEFNNFTAMFVDGIKYFLVELAYIIVPIIIGLIFVYLGSTFNNGAVSIVGLIITFVLLIISFFYCLVAVPNMIANDGSMKEAFDFKRLTEIIKTIGVGQYIGFYIGVIIIVALIYLVVSVILAFIFGLFGFATIFVYAPGLPVIGYILLLIYNLILAFLVAPYISLFTGRAEGLIYGIGE